MPRPEDLVWQLMMKGAVAPFKVAGYAFRAGARASSNASAKSVGRLPYFVRRSGVLAPGDPPPAPGFDLMDYRGVAETQAVRPLVGGPISLGRHFDCRRGRGAPIGLAPQMLFRHAAVVGPPGSGKTHSVIIPWIVSLLRMGSSVVTIDVKGDLLANIQRHAAVGGPTGAQLQVWDYSGAPSHRWNWLAETTDTRAIEAAVVSILGKENKSDPQPFFYFRDVRWLRALIRLVNGPGRQGVPVDLVRLVSSQSALQTALCGAGAPAGTNLQDLATMEPDEFSRAAAGLQNSLAIFGEPRVQRVTETSDFRLSDVSAKPTLLVGVAPLADGNLGDVLSGMLISQVVMQVLARFGSSQHPLFLIIDEAPRLKSRIDFEQILAVARGASVGVCLACQDVAQFGDEATRSALLTSCDTLVVMPGSSNETATYLSKRLGERLIETRSVTQTGGSSFAPNYSVSGAVSNGPVLGNREIMHPPFGPYVSVIHARSTTRMPILSDLSI